MTLSDASSDTSVDEPPATVALPDVSVVLAAGAWPEPLATLESDIIAACHSVWNHVDTQRYTMLDVAFPVVLSEDAHLHTLNQRYRHKDSVTNVLSFPSDESPGQWHVDYPGVAFPLGDVLLACETVHREAQEKSIPFAHHVVHLAAHGMLHLLGFDHQTESEAKAMEAIEISVLAQHNIPNPYTVDA